MRISPAEWVIRTIGGVRKTARAIGKTPPTVSSWRKQRGSGGEVPSSNHKKILRYARVKRLDITAEDLIFGRVTSKEA